MTGKTTRDSRMRDQAAEPSVNTARRPPHHPVSVELHVDELVLHGFAPGDGWRIGDAVQQELSRLMTNQGLPWSHGGPVNIEHLDAGSFVAGPAMKTGSIGLQVAEKLHRGLARTGTPGMQPAQGRREGQK